MSDDPMKKIDTPRGVGARSMTSLSPSAVEVSYSQAGNFTGNGADWMGPLVPMLPVAPSEVSGRALDYMPGYNLLARPRADTPITFELLRRLAENCDVLRIILERRKDQACRLEWTIRPTLPDGAGKRPKTLSAQTRNLIRDVREFVSQPALDLSWREWLRVVLEDHFVIDAVALYCERSRSGELLELQPIDGGLIKRTIDAWGRTPRPVPWTGQPFTWDGFEINAQNASQYGKIVNGYWFLVAYQAVLHGLPATNYTVHDLIYRAANKRSHSLWGFSIVEQIINTVNIQLRRSTSQLEYFREGNQPESIYGLPETWTPDQTMRFQDYWDSLFVGHLGNRRRMKFLPAGKASAYTALKEPPLKSEFDEWIARVICAAFSYPPSAFVSLSNRSIAEQHDRSGEEEGLQNTKLFIADLLNSVIAEEFGADADTIEFAWVEEDEVDQERQAIILRGYAADGILTINEVRERLGEEPLSDEAASKPMVKTSNGYKPIGGGAKGDDDRVDEEDDSLADDDASKLAKGAIIMSPPVGGASKRFTLNGITYIPNTKGQLIVPSDEHALALEAEGWTRKSTSTRSRK